MPYHLLLANLDALHGNNLLFDLVTGAVAGVIVGIVMRKKKLQFLLSIGLGIIGGFIMDILFGEVMFFSKILVVNEIIDSLIGGILLSIIVSLITGDNSNDRDRTSYHV